MPIRVAVGLVSWEEIGVGAVELGEAAFDRREAGSINGVHAAKRLSGTSSNYGGAEAHRNCEAPCPL